jgi:putative transposase
MDLRVRVLEYLSRGHTQTEASQVFGFGRKSIYNWLCLKEKSGSVAMQRRGRRQPSKFEEPRLREYVAAHPDDHLSEIASFFKGTASGVYRALKRLKITRKKSRFSTRNVMRLNDRSSSRL